MVIGMAARELPLAERRTAIVLGGTLAVVLRIIATAVVSLLLAIPLLQLLGGIVLAFIAYRLVVSDHGPATVAPSTTLRGAILTILVADAAMSLENVLGVGAAAHGDIPLLAFGLALSIPIVLFGSGLVATMLDRSPRLIWLGASALAWTAVDLALGDPSIAGRVPDHWGVEAVLTILLGTFIVVARRVVPGGVRGRHAN